MIVRQVRVTSSLLDRVASSMTRRLSLTILRVSTVPNRQFSPPKSAHQDRRPVLSDKRRDGRSAKLKKASEAQMSAPSGLLNDALAPKLWSSRVRVKQEEMGNSMEEILSPG